MYRQTYYTSEWKNKIEYSKISLRISGKVSEEKFFCRICHTKPFELGNIGVEAWKNIQPYKKS